MSAQMRRVGDSDIPCSGETSNHIFDYSGDERTETVCGHPERSHYAREDGSQSCGTIIGDGCDIGEEHGGRHCNCKEFVRP